MSSYKQGMHMELSLWGVLRHESCFLLEQLGYQFSMESLRHMWKGGLNSVSVTSWPGDFGGITSVTKGDKRSTLFGRINDIMHTKAPSLCCLHFFPSLTETACYLGLQNDIGLL